MQNCLGLFLHKRACLEPGRIGLIFEGREISYREWSRRAACAARAFVALGIRPQDRVGLLLENSPEFLECFFALVHIGAVVVPLNWRFTAAEISVIVEDSGIRALVHGGVFHGLVGNLNSRLAGARLIAVGGPRAPGGYDYEELLATQSSSAPQAAGVGQDPAAILYTSGTTGRPKGAVLAHDTLFHGMLNISASLDWRTGDRVLVAMPLFHIGALIISLINVYRGATTVLMRAFDPDTFLRHVEASRIDSFVAVEAMLQPLVETERFGTVDLSSLRWVLSGPLPPSLRAAWARRGVVIQPVYGLTETTGGAAVLAAEHVVDKPGSTGLPMFHTDIRVVGEDGHDCEAGTTGEILIRGPHVTRAYWNNPAATAEAIQEGWLATGDLGWLDEEGYLYIVGRSKDMIRSGGENIYPAELESLLAEMPQTREVAIVGIPDATWGQTVCAIVRLRPGEKLDLQEIVAYCAGRLARFKIPRRLFVTEEPFPRGPAGRVQKQELIRKLLEHDELQDSRTDF